MKNKKLILFFVIGFSFLSPNVDTCAFPDEISENETIREITDPSEMISVLDLIGSRMRDNYEKIKTWKGEVDVEIRLLHSGENAVDTFQTFTDGEGESPKDILQVIHENVEFAIDVNNNRVYVDSNRPQPSQYFDFATKQNLGNSGSNPYRSICIATSDFVIKATPRRQDPKDKKIIAQWVKKVSSETDRSTGLYNRVDDPRNIFFPGSSFPWKHYDLKKNMIQKYGAIEFDGYRYRIYELRRGDFTDYKIISPSVLSDERSSPDHYLVIIKICSEEHNYNFTSWKIFDGAERLLNEYTWEYELIDGIDLPKKTIKADYNFEGEVAYKIESFYKINTLNQPIDAVVFDCNHMPLYEGDILIDEIKNKKFRFDSQTKEFKEIDN